MVVDTDQYWLCKKLKEIKAGIKLGVEVYEKNQDVNAQLRFTTPDGQ